MTESSAHQKLTGQSVRRRALGAVSRIAAQLEKTGVEPDPQMQRLMYLTYVERSLLAYLERFYHDVRLRPDEGSEWGDYIVQIVGEDLLDLGGEAGMLVDSHDIWTVTEAEWVELMMDRILDGMMNRSTLFEPEPELELDPIQVYLPEGFRVAGVCRDCGDLVITNDGPQVGMDDIVEYRCLSEGIIDGDDDVEGTDQLGRYIKTRPTEADLLVNWLASLESARFDAMPGEFADVEARQYLAEAVDKARFLVGKEG